MRIDIQARGFELSDGLREHTERRLQFALSWASHSVRTVTVRLSDVNGPRGGNDKCCSIQIPLVRAQDVVIEDTESDLYVAIDRAAERAERAEVVGIVPKHHAEIARRGPEMLPFALRNHASACAERDHHVDIGLVARDNVHDIF